MILIHSYESLSSTMDEARNHVLQGAEESTVIVAKYQTAGRGRRGRSWESLPGNLYLTYITYQDCPLAVASQLSFVSCVAVGEAVGSFLSPEYALLYKWPNDLLLNGKKVGGILLEAFPLLDQKETAYLIGCGINLISAPSQTRYLATAFQREGIHLPYENTLQKVGESLKHYISLWQEKGFSPFRNLWMSSTKGLGESISLDLEGKRWEGIYQGIDNNGALILSTPEGPLTFTAGEIL